MSNTALANSTDSKLAALGEMVPVDPFRSLYVHFGMLLGVEDFRTLDAYHRGKMWFHSAWLHGAGTVWGLSVSVDQPRNEIRVEPGVALDALGRELYLQQAACLNLASWYEQHKEDPELGGLAEVDDATGAVTFTAHVVLQFKACLSRQVPAIAEPCDGSNASTAYSRVVETVELALIPGPAPRWRDEPGQLPYHRLRVLFGLDAALTDDDGVALASDQSVLEARASILALPPSDQPAAYLAALRRFAALDQMDIGPAQIEGQDNNSLLFPAVDPAAIPLADLNNLTLIPTESGWNIESGDVDNTIRPVLLSTSTIQELLCGPPNSAATPPDSEDAGGPRIDPDSVLVNGNTLQFNTLGGPLMKASVAASGLSVSVFEVNNGWAQADVNTVQYDEAASQVQIELTALPAGNLVRLIVYGTGPAPFMGRNRIPLAGAINDGPGSTNNGNDFVAMIRV